MSIEKKIGYRELVQRAMAEVITLSALEALEIFQQGESLFIDLRDIRELKREGKIPGAVHVPRGMLEFWLDPDSPYFKEVFQKDSAFIFYCNKGWRSALATLTAQQMGLLALSHIDGGFAAWCEINGPVEEI